jgi:amidase
MYSDEAKIEPSDTTTAEEYGFQDSFNRFMASLGDNAPVASLADVVAYNKEDAANRAPYGQGFVEGSVNTTITAEQNEALKENNMQNSAGALRGLFEKYNVDVIMFRFFTQEYAPAGFPALTVPDGLGIDGEPISVILVGDYLSEPQLIAVGYAYEQATQARVEPDLEATMQQIQTMMGQ